MKFRFMSLLLAVMVMSSACAGSTSDPVVTTDTPQSSLSDTIPEDDDNVYKAGVKDLEGYEFRFMNVIDDLWDTDSMILDFEEQTGDTLHDAIYNRNRQVENDLNITIAPVVKYSIFELSAELKRAVLAGEDAYDAAYICTSNYAGTIPYLNNFYDISSIQLSEDWWSRSFVESMTVGDNLLYGSVDYVNNWTQLFVSALFFNKEMVTDHGLDSPYELVRSGKWTLDTMKTMMSEVVNLNGDADFKPLKGGNCVYGHASMHAEAPLSLMQGTDNNLIKKDKNNMLSIVNDLGTYVSTYEKLLGLCGEEGYNVLVNTAEYRGMDIFLEGRALFHQSNMSYALSPLFRESDMEYGVIPMPKYDANQSRYYTPISQYGMVVTIPLTVSDPERSGYVIDYMNWMSHRDVYPTLLTNMCYKGVRDDDSIEMLDVIFDSVQADIGFLWGISNSTQMEIAQNAVGGVDEVMSVIEKSRAVMEEKIDGITGDIS